MITQVQHRACLGAVLVRCGLALLSPMWTTPPTIFRSANPATMWTARTPHAYAHASVHVRCVRIGMSLSPTAYIIML